MKSMSSWGKTVKNESQLYREQEHAKTAEIHRTEAKKLEKQLASSNYPPERKIALEYYLEKHRQKAEYHQKRAG